MNQLLYGTHDCILKMAKEASTSNALARTGGTYCIYTKLLNAWETISRLCQAGVSAIMTKE
jgi:hypothetical protein